MNYFLLSIEPTKYHPKKKELNDEAVELWNLVEQSYNKMIGNEDSPIAMQPVLPNLVTSTDKCTVYATSSIVNGKDTLYLVSKPTSESNKSCDSGTRNHYKRKVTGDSHCRGVRVVINSTFTAGGLTSPLFIVVYGFTAEELPSDDIVTVEIEGLTPGSDQDIYSSGKGFVTFVRGKYDPKSEDETSSMEEEDVETTEDVNPDSKEARVAEIYRKLVYHPFISQIRKTRYGWSGDLDDIPEYLRAISWMDGG